MNYKTGILGGLFVTSGLLLLLNNIFNFDFFSSKYLWPLLIVLIGLLFEWGYFHKKRDPGLLVPGGILTITGLLFLFENFTAWRFSGYTWPVYPLAVAIGLFQLYWFSERKRGLLLAAGILTAFSLLSFSLMEFGSLLDWLNMSFVLPAVLICFGIGLFLKGTGASKKR